MKWSNEYREQQIQLLHLEEQRQQQWQILSLLHECCCCCPRAPPPLLKLSSSLSSIAIWNIIVVAEWTSCCFLHSEITTATIIKGTTVLALPVASPAASKGSHSINGHSNEGSTGNDMSSPSVFLVWPQLTQWTTRRSLPPSALQFRNDMRRRRIPTTESILNTTTIPSPLLLRLVRMPTVRDYCCITNVQMSAPYSPASSSSSSSP